MNKIIDKMINYMFDNGIAYITERKDEEEILTPTLVAIFTNGKVFVTNLPSYLAGKEQFQIITEILKEGKKGRLIMPDGRKNKKIKLGVFLYFTEAWVASGEDNIRPTDHPDRQTAICAIAGDVDGYYHGVQTVSACNGKSVVGDRELCQFNLNDNCSGRFSQILKNSNLKFEKMDDETTSKVITEIPLND